MNEPMSAELALSNIIDIAKERCSAEGHECDWECSLLDRSITVANNTKVISHWCRKHGVLSVVPAELTWSNPGIRGGEPCIKGTRVQAYLVATLLEHGATWEQVKDIYPSIPTPEAPREAAQPGAGDAETSGTGRGRGTGELKAHGSAQAAEEWGVQLNGGSVVPIQGPDARETAEEFRVAFVEQSRRMGRSSTAVIVHRVIRPWAPLDEEAGDER